MASAMFGSRRAATRGLILVVCSLGSVLTARAQEDVPVVEAGYGEDVEARLQKLERTLQGRGLLDLANQVEALQAEVQRLRGELEQQQHLIEQLQAGAAQPPVAAAPPANPDPRWPTPAAAVAPATTDTAPGAASPPVATVPQVPATPAAPSSGAPGNASGTELPAAAPTASVPTSADPDQAYSAAFNALKAGQYGDAIAQFNNFLVTHPDSERADSAQYWLGEAYYVSKQFDPAINEYQKLVAAYPKSQKVSQAMLKIGFCQQELGQRDAAKATLQEVLQRFPGTTSARMAEDRLQRMRLEQAP